MHESRYCRLDRPRYKPAPLRHGAGHRQTRSFALDSADIFTARDIYRKQWSLLDDREIVDEALGELVEAGWLLQSVQSAGFQMRAHVRYRVNPKARSVRNG